MINPLSALNPVQAAEAARRARDTLTGNSLINFTRGFAGQPAHALGQIAGHYGFANAAEALTTGRIDTLVSAVGADAIGLLAKEGAALVNRRLDAITGKYGEMLKALDRSDPAPAGLVMLVLGDVPFMVGTVAHQTLTRSHEYRWATHERLLRTPARQFLGPGEESITLEGYLLPHYTGGTETLQRLRQLAHSGEPHTLLDHFGAVYGLYVIERLEQTGSELDMLGQPRHMTFSIALAAYGEDDAPPPLAAAAIAANTNTPLPDNEGAA